MDTVSVLSKIVLLLYWLSEQNRETLQNPENVSNEMSQEKNATPFSFVCSGFLSSGLILTDISSQNTGYNRGPGHNPDVTGSWFLFWCCCDVFSCIARWAGAWHCQKEEGTLLAWLLATGSYWILVSGSVPLRADLTSYQDWILLRVCVCSFVEVYCCVCLQF